MEIPFWFVKTTASPPVLGATNYKAMDYCNFITFHVTEYGNQLQFTKRAMILLLYKRDQLNI